MRVSGKNSSVGASKGPGQSRSQGIGSALGASPLSTVHSVSAVRGAAGADALQVSSDAQLLAVAQAEVAQVPDVRLEKVEALRAQLDADAYNPDGEAVANGLLREHTAGSSLY
jgi:negative regulator of flagellin synthesis FlgM